MPDPYSVWKECTRCGRIRLMDRSAQHCMKITEPDGRGGGPRCMGDVREVGRLSRTRFVETTPDGDLFAFRCEGCGSEGEVVIPTSIGRQFKMECCGANYVRLHLSGEAPRLVAVIVPIAVRRPVL